MVKPPGLGIEGQWTSSHWPGRNWVLLVGVCEVGE